MPRENVVLVDKNNKKVGIEEKIKAHVDAKLHRAFSILIFNSKGHLLIQQRSKAKYHCAALWANTVCSHPRPGEKYITAAHRRLLYELGFDCGMKKYFCMTYYAEFPNGLAENEYDCVFVGRFSGKPKPNPEEVMDCKWISLKDLKKDVKKNPNRYTPWLGIILKRIKTYELRKLRICES